MKSEKEQHGGELGPKTPKQYENYFEPVSQRPTFSERTKSSAGHLLPGHDKKWSASPMNGDPRENKEPTPVSGVAGPKQRRYSTVDEVTHGNYDPIQGRVPDEGKTFKASAPTGNAKLYVNQGPHTPANKREIKIGWRNRGYALGEDASAGAPVTVPSTPQKKRLRKTEG